MKRGYADGNYMCICHNCKGLFQGDKRARTCKGCAKAADRIEELEYKLERAVEALVAWRYYDENVEQDHVSLMLNYADAIEKTRGTLAELKGGNDE